MMKGPRTIYYWMLSMQLLESGADNASQIGQDLWQIIGQQSAKSAYEPHSLGSACVKPVEAVPVVYQ